MACDLVKRLRSPELYTEVSGQALMNDAADHIQELEQINRAAEDEIDDLESQINELKFELKKALERNL